MRFIKNFKLFEIRGGLEVDSSIYNKVENLIDELLVKYKGGFEFFEALDRQIKTVMSEEIILNLTKKLENEFIASSGEFGDIAYKLYESGKIKCKGFIVFNGKILTQNRGIEYFYPENFNLSDKEYVYIDDSYFSGKTVKTINNFLNKYNSSIKGVNVVYNGSPEKTNFVKSIYRYY